MPRSLSTSRLSEAKFNIQRDTAALVRLEIITTVTHIRSQRVAEKTGALREGVQHQRLLLHDVHHDAVLFALLRPAGAA